MNIPQYHVKLVRERTVRYKISDPESATTVLRHLCCERGDREVMAVVYLDGRAQMVGCEVVAIGGANALSVRVAEVLRGAVLAGATAIVLGHVHPSGDPTPSDEDIAMTKAIASGGDTLGIALVDHVIVTDDASFSFLQEGMLP